MTLAEIARRCQGPDRTNAAFAAEIGCEPATLTRLYKGELPFSLTVVRGLLREYPEVQDELVALLAHVPGAVEPVAVS